MKKMNLIPQKNTKKQKQKAKEKKKKLKSLVSSSFLSPTHIVGSQVQKQKT
jgi:hypothetical protein